MQLSLSVRIAEAATKDHMTVPFGQFAELAARCRYPAVCMRASAGGTQSSLEDLDGLRRKLDELGLRVSMATTDFDVPLNNENGPNNLRDIGPHLDAAEALGADLIRICMKTEDDVAAAQRACDLARERGIRLAHQCHTNSLFETVDGILDVLGRVGRENFGLIYEPANLMLCGQPYGQEVLERLAPYLMNVYLQNHRLSPEGDDALLTRIGGEVRYFDIPLWERGGVEFDAVFAGLRAIGYDGTVTVHQQFAKIMGPDEAAEKSQAYLTSLADFG